MYTVLFLSQVLSYIILFFYDYDCSVAGVFWMPLKFPTFNFLFHLATDITTLEHLGTSQMKPHLEQLLKLVLRGPSVRRVSFHIYRQTTLSNYCPQTIAYFFVLHKPSAVYSISYLPVGICSCFVSILKKVSDFFLSS